MATKKCNPVELRTLLRISILVPFFAVFNTLLTDVLVPALEGKQTTTKNLKSRVIIAISWPVLLYLLFNIGLKDCD